MNRPIYAGIPLLLLTGAALAQSPLGQLSGELSQHTLTAANQRSSCLLQLNELTGINRTPPLRLPATRPVTARLLAFCAKTAQGTATEESGFRFSVTLTLDTPMDTPSGFPNQGDGRWDLHAPLPTSLGASAVVQVAPAEAGSARYEASIKVDHRQLGGTAPLFCDTRQGFIAGLGSGANTTLSQTARCDQPALRGAGTTVSGEGAVASTVTLRLASADGVEVWEPVIEIVSAYNFFPPRLALDPEAGIRVLTQAGSVEPGEARLRVINDGREQMDWKVVVPPETTFTANLTGGRQPGERIAVEAVPAEGQPIGKGRAQVVTVRVNTRDARTTGNWRFDLRVESLNGGNKTIPVQVDVEPFQGLDEVGIDAASLAPAPGELTVATPQAFRARVPYAFRSRAEADLVLRLFDGDGLLIRSSAPLRVQRNEAPQAAELEIPAFVLPERAGALSLRAVLLDIPSAGAQPRLVKQSAEVRYALSTDTPDLTVARLEAVQVVQDEAQTIPLIARKKTALRVFVKQDRENGAAMQARVTVEGFRAGQPLPGSPIEIPGTVAGRASHDRANRLHSATVILPDAWTEGGEIEVAATLQGPPDRAERTTANNTERRTLRFVELDGAPRPWVIEYFRVCYGAPGAAASAPDGMVGTADGYLRKLFPVAAADLVYRPFRAPCAVWSSEITDENSSRFTAWVRKFYEAIHPARNAPGQLTGWFDQFRLGLAGAPDPGWNESGNVTWQLHDRSLGRLYNAHTLANQVARNLGRRLPNTEDSCGARDEGTDWRTGETAERRATARTLEVGFDPETGEPKAADKFDLMSYCSSGDSIWISPFTYRKLIEGRLQSRAPAAVRAADTGGEHLIVSGTVAREGSVAALDAAYRVPAGGRAIDAPAAGTHALRVMGESGPLAEHKFTLRFQHPRDSRAVASEGFTLRIPYPVGARRVVLVRGEETLAELTADGASPVVAITTPQAGARWEGVEQALAWTASHPTGKELTFLAQYSADGGESWTPLAVDLKGNEFRFQPSQITGGPRVHFRVIATSGLDQAEATVGPVEVVQAPRIEASAADVNFRKVVLGETKTAAVTLRNPGTGPLTVRALRSDAAAFRIAEGAGAEIPAGSERLVTVEFAPASAGSHSGALVVETDDAARGQLRIPLLGAGVRTAEPDAQIGPLALDFGSVEVGQSWLLDVSVRNHGPGVLSITDAISTNARFTVTEPAVPFQVPATGERRAVVRFTPAAAGEVTGELRLPTNDPSAPMVVIALKGTGRAPVVPPPPEGNPVPVLTRLSPASAVAGGPEFVMTLTGSNFRSGTTGEWNGAPRTTALISDTELRMTVTAADIASSGTSSISVFSPAPGGGRSLSLGFRIEPPAPPPPPAGPSILIQQFRLTACPDVTAYVSVLDAAGAPIERLTVGNLSCADDNSPVRCGIQTAGSEPVSVAIVLGLNGLNANDVEAAKAAGRVLINRLGGQDRATVVHLESAASQIGGMTSDKAALVTAIGAIRPVGGTNALYDAISLAVSLVAEERGRRQAVFVITPNENIGGSILNPTEALSRASRAGIPVFSAGFGPGANNVPLAGFLRNLATETHARTAMEARIGDLQPRMEQYWRLLSAQYALTFPSVNDFRTRLFRVNLVAGQVTATNTRAYQGCR